MLKVEKNLARPYELPLTFTSTAQSCGDFWDEFGFVMQAAKFSQELEGFTHHQITEASKQQVVKVSGSVTNMEFRFASIDSTILGPKN